MPSLPSLFSLAPRCALAQFKHPLIHNNYYVDGIDGSDSNDGLTEPFETLQKAFDTISALSPSSSNRFTVTALTTFKYILPTAENVTLPPYTTLDMGKTRWAGKLIASANSAVHVDTMTSSDSNVFETASSGGGQVHLFVDKLFADGGAGTVGIRQPDGTINLFLHANYMSIDDDNVNLIQCDSNLFDAFTGYIGVMSFNASGGTALQYNGNGSASLFVNSIKKNTGTNNTALAVNGSGTLNVTANKIDTDIAYNITSGALNITANKLSGLEIRTGGITRRTINSKTRDGLLKETLISDHTPRALASTAIPVIDVLPSTTEGATLLSTPYTTSDTDKVRLQFDAWINMSFNSSGNHSFAGLWVDSETSTREGAPYFDALSGGRATPSFAYEARFDGNTAHTFRIRGGSQHTNTVYMNRRLGGIPRDYGGALAVTLRIREYLDYQN